MVKFLFLMSCTFAFCQTSIDKDSLLTNYLSKVGIDNLEEIDSYSTTYVAKTAMGEYIYEDVYFKDKISKKIFSNGKVITSIFISKKHGCYTEANGVKSKMQKNFCDFTMYSVGFFPELNLINNPDITIEEVKDQDIFYYVVKTPKSVWNGHLYYDKETNLKIKDVIINTQFLDKLESINEYKDYKMYDMIMLPETRIDHNFLLSGLKVEFKLYEVKFNVEDNISFD